MRRRTTRYLKAAALIGVVAAVLLAEPQWLDASSHREAPLLLNDPQADNTDVYAFRDPNNTGNVIIVANYVPLELPSGGPNYHNFGENVRYEIHVKNQTSTGALGTATDDITYRFTFELENEDPTTFFKIRLGKTNLKASYTMEKSTDGGATFQSVISDGFVAPPNVGPRAIENETVGLGTSYDQLTQDAITTASSGEQVFVGPRDDAFFVDLGGAFDVGNFRDQFGDDPSNAANARDAVAGFNTHSIVLRVPIEKLQKDGMTVDEAESILDPNFVIGVWASASRPQIKTLSTDGSAPTYEGPWIQVSRLGMPLTNEVVIPIGEKDRWNATTPYDEAEQDFIQYFVNPELALYMGNGQFGPAVPSLSEDLVIQMNSYPAIGDVDGDGEAGFDFTNTADGVYDLVEAGNVDFSGTAFAQPLKPTGTNSPTALAGEGEPRRVDVLPIFYFGVPNLIPYQLATGKENGPLSAGKPFIHNFLPITQTPDGGLYGGDMLRLNMATPTTDRSSEEFETFAFQGLIRAAALGLTAEPYNQSAMMEFIPHMDGFPNGRRLEDDVTTIELQAVAGLVLSAVGLPEDDATAADYSDLASDQLLDELQFVAGPTENDVVLPSTFPYLAEPHRGFSYVRDVTAEPPPFPTGTEGMGYGVPSSFIIDQNYPNPFSGSTTIEYHVSQSSNIRVQVYDVQGRLVATLVNRTHAPGNYTTEWGAEGIASGTYFYRIEADGRTSDTRKAVFVK